MVKLHYGGSVCGPVFRRVMREALIRLGVRKDPMPMEDGSGEVRPEPTMSAVFELAVLEPDVFDEDMDALELIPAHEDRTGAGPRLPDFAGMTKREAKGLLVSLGLPWDPQGAGRVVRQEPAAGTLLQEVRLCKLVFSNV